MYLPVGITETEHRDEILKIRRQMLALRKQEIEQQKQGAIWDFLQIIAVGAIPVMAFFGIRRIKDLI